MNKQAGFSIGQIIQHRLLQYRGVVFDVDAEFQGSESWYDEQAGFDSPPKDEPWYHVLVEGDNRAAYVPQRSLMQDYPADPVDSPLLEHFFTGYQDGYYRSKTPMH